MAVAANDWMAMAYDLINPSMQIIVINDCGLANNKYYVVLKHSVVKTPFVVC